MRPNVAVLRSAQASWLTEHGTVTRAAEGKGPWNDETGQYDPLPPVLVHDGPMLVRPQQAAEQRVDVVGVQYTVTRYDVTLPALTDVKIGDKVTVTDSPFDPALQAVELTILDVPLDVWQVARYCVAALATG